MLSLINLICRVQTYLASQYKVSEISHHSINFFLRCDSITLNTMMFLTIVIPHLRCSISTQTPYSILDPYFYVIMQTYVILLILMGKPVVFYGCPFSYFVRRIPIFHIPQNTPKNQIGPLILDQSNSLFFSRLIVF